ncbi:MAG: sulfotransferase [Hyphomonas sp.]
MAFKGDPLHKKILQGFFASLGYKLVKLKAYEQRNAAGRANTDFNKVFGVGFNKTATTTLEQVLRDCGFRMPKQLEQEALLAAVIEAKDYNIMRKFIADFDAVQDLPFSQNNTYVACDALFPGSKFILTVRDPQKWVDSYIKFYQREFDLEDETTFSEASFLGKTQYLHRDYVHKLMRRLLVEEQEGHAVVRWDMAFDRDFLIAAYQRRNAEIRSYFAQRPNDFFELDPSKEADTGRLLGFLGLTDIAPGPYPRANKG